MRNTNWVFGDNAGLKFSPTPTPFSNKPINMYEGCASISDTGGNLAVYSDGWWVRDGSGTVQATGLQGHQSSTQSALIVPDPGNKKRYYVLTTDGSSGGNKHFNGILINTTSWVSTPLMSLMTMPPTAAFSPTEKLIAVGHANKKDFWVLTLVQPLMATPPMGFPGIGYGILRAFLVTSAGISYVGDQALDQLVGDVGYMKASKDGKHIALANLALANVLLIPFSNATGHASISSVTKIPVLIPPTNVNGYVYGVEFSPSGKILYYSTLFPLPIASSPVTDGRVFQFPLPSGPPVLVGTHPNDKNGDIAIGALQLGSDGRIYIAQDGEKKLGVIANPDLPGAACNLTFSALTLAPGSTCRAGLPNMIRDLF